MQAVSQKLVRVKGEGYQNQKASDNCFLRTEKVMQHSPDVLDVAVPLEMFVHMVTMMCFSCG